MKIGIPRALLYYRYGTMWEMYFRTLGFETVVSPLTNKRIMDEGSRYTVDENCVSSKLFFGHVAELEGKCDAVFVPRIASLSKNMVLCSRFEALSDMTKAIFRGHDIDILTTNIDIQQGKTAKRAYLELGRELGVTAKEASDAYEKGIHAQASEIIKKIRDAKKKLAQPGIKILISGHPYNLYDEYIGMPILRQIESLGAIPICSDQMEPRLARKHASDIAARVPWAPNREQLGAISHYHDSVDGIILMTAFPCGPDSMVNEMIIRKIKDRPILNLLLDAQSGNAGIETRLESFIDIIRFREKVNF